MLGGPGRIPAPGAELVLARRFLALAMDADDVPLMV